VTLGCWATQVLRYGIPLLGIICCAVVGLAVQAAATEGRRLADARALACQAINTLSPVRIPLIGVGPGLRDRPWTHRCGSLPLILPWVLGTFWIALLLV